jgi:hypothetical protein
VRQQIETRKALAQAASGRSWSARRVMDVGYMVADNDNGNAVARLWVEMGDLVDGFHAVGSNPLDTSKHIAFNDPQQVLADCEFDLALLDEHRRVDEQHPELPACGGCGFDSVEEHITPNARNCPVVKRLAFKYRHRAGYLPEWATEGATP